jgi:hypothetical protein
LNALQAISGSTIAVTASQPASMRNPRSVLGPVFAGQPKRATMSVI